MCGLKDYEVHAIRSYTMDGYRCVNKYLRAGLSDETQGFVDALNTGLEKLPSIRGFVSRGDILPDSVRMKYQKGATVTHDGYTSASTHMMTERDIFTIYSLTGKPVMPFSLYPTENEVIFKPGTKFRVLHVIPSVPQYQVNQFLLREVKDDETESEAKKEDDRIISLARDMAAKGIQDLGEKSFSWNCSSNKNRTTKSIEIESFPVHRDSGLRWLK